MNLRNSLMVFASAVALPAFADPGLTLMRGELGYVERPVVLTKSRAEVLNELAAWKRSPVSADGWREVGGQQGWVYVGSSTKSRGQVQQELRQALANPVTPDGWRFFPGERGWTYVGQPGSAGGVRTAASGK